jgi:hypothetical protein
VPRQQLCVRLPGRREARTASPCCLHLPRRLRLRRRKGRLPVLDRACRGVSAARRGTGSIADRAHRARPLRGGALAQPIPLNQFHVRGVSATTRERGPVLNVQFDVGRAMP